MFLFFSALSFYISNETHIKQKCNSNSLRELQTKLSILFQAYPASCFYQLISHFIIETLYGNKFLNINTCYDWKEF